MLYDLIMKVWNIYLDWALKGHDANQLKARGFFKYF